MRSTLHDAFIPCLTNAMQQRMYMSMYACMHEEARPGAADDAPACPVPPAISKFALREPRKIVLKIRNFSICTGTTARAPAGARLPGRPEGLPGGGASRHQGHAAARAHRQFLVPEPGRRRAQRQGLPEHPPLAARQVGVRRLRRVRHQLPGVRRRLQGGRWQAAPRGARPRVVPVTTMSHSIAVTQYRAQTEKFGISVSNFRGLYGTIHIQSDV